MAYQDDTSGKKNSAGDKGVAPKNKTSGQDKMNVEHEAKERLGTGLRSLYRNVLEEPLPADMMALLDQLDDDDDDNSGSSNSGAAN